jgi:hypothetical protein
VLVRGPKSEPKHGPTSFKWVVPGYHVVSCYHVGQPKAHLVKEQKNLFFPIFVAYFFLHFCNRIRK